MNVITELNLQNTPRDKIGYVISEAISSAPPLLKLTGLGFPSVNKPTPPDWNVDCVTENDARFLEIASYVGTVFGFADLQGGREIQEIFPIRRDAQAQVGSGAIKLELHTEDPALEYRADYLGFLCVSNNDRVPTIVSVPDLSLLPREVIECLSRPTFRIYTDRPGRNKEKYLTTPVINREPSGRWKLIYDPVYIDRALMSEADLNAFNSLTELVEGSVTDFLLEPGEIGFIDNYQVAHGRPQYEPRYDGTDRWLKRVQISLDLGRFSAQAILPGKLMP